MASVPSDGDAIAYIDNAFAFPGWRRRGTPGAPPVALVLLNRPVPPAFLRAMWGAADYRVAADGAARRLLDTVPADRRRDFLPDAVCGDFDSLDEVARAELAALGVPVLFDADQDSTDLHKCLALLHALADGGSGEAKGGADSSRVALAATAPPRPRPLAGPASALRVVVLGAFGGRLDHTVQACAALLDWAPRFGAMVLADAECTAAMLPAGRTHVFVAEPFEGPTVGLLPLGRPVASLTTTGLRWDVTDWATEIGERGVVSTSNHVIAWGRGGGGGGSGCGDSGGYRGVDGDGGSRRPHVVVVASGPLVWTCAVDASAVVAAGCATAS